MKTQTYRSTVYACYLGNFVQAIIINLTPILFIPLMHLYDLNLSALGILAGINFLTQVIADLVFAKAVDKYGFRPFAVGASLVAFLGFMIFMGAPTLFPQNPFLGFTIGTILCASSGGLLELLLSPIINALPSNEKSAAMSVLHSFFAWGQLSVILLTTFLLFVLGNGSWQVIVFFWSLFSFVSIFIFLKVPFCEMVPESEQTPSRLIWKNARFLLCLLLILCGGASEQVSAQWISSFFELELKTSKVVGDVVGIGSFSLVFAVCRLLYGKIGAKLPVLSLMRYGMLVCIFSFLLLSFSTTTWLSVLGCMGAGIGVSLLWPGTLSLCASYFPLAGTWMFAILAFAGDVGCSSGPSMVGLLSDHVSDIPIFNSLYQLFGIEHIGLRIGVLFAAIFPLIGFIVASKLKKTS